MMKVWRSHARLLASLLLFASPAVGGLVLPLAHPCPVDAPWLADAGAAESDDLADASHHAHHGTVAASSDAPEGVPSSGHDSHTDCSCIGLCAAPAVLLAPQGLVALVPAIQVPTDRPQWPVVDATETRHQLLDLLPPTTAPPQV